AVEHRLEFVRSVSGVEFYNDSKATSVDATLKALDAFAGGLWVILGGKDKGLEYTALRAPLAAKAHAALLIGAAAPKIAEQLQGAVPLVSAGTIEAAIAHAYAHAVPGDTALLAPASTSSKATSSVGSSSNRLSTNCKRKIDMAQRLKTDWILFSTVLAMVFS